MSVFVKTFHCVDVCDGLCVPTHHVYLMLCWLHYDDESS